MSEENSNAGSGFEASPEEMAFVVKMRNATQALSPAEVAILRKRRETGSAAGEGDQEVCLEDIRHGASPETLSAILRKMREVAG